MAKTLKTVAIIAGVVALAATGVGAFAAAGTALAATAATTAAIASVTAAVASVGSTLLTKPPNARGNVSNIIIASNAPQPYLMGRTYAGGVMRHDAAYGGTVDKVPNPYRIIITVYSGAGPIESIEAIQADYTTISFSSGAATGYFANFFYTDTQLGATPESTALTANFTSPTKWGASHKLSGYAAVLYNLKFDKKGKIFASGVPRLGIIAEGVKVYDPRLDSTYPGGSGSHRITDETTWTYSQNPALHAIAYIYGRYQNSKRVFGIGMPVEGIALEYFVSLANLCDANVWKVGGVIFEPDDKWDNLKNILAAASAEPVFSNGQISCRYDAAVVSLDTITEADLTSAPTRVPASQPWADTINGVIPAFRSEAHNWEYVDGDIFSVSSYVTADGLEKNERIQFNLVQDADQATELAAYRVYNARELTPIEVTVKSRFRSYRPGEALTVTLPEVGLNAQVCLIISRTIDPATMDVTLVLRTETASKHAAALGLTGGTPPTPALFDTEATDLAVARLAAPDGFEEELIRNSYVLNNPLSASDAGSNATIAVASHDRHYADKDTTVALGTITGLAYSQKYYVYYDDSTRSDTAPTFAATVVYGDSYLTATNPNRHSLGSITTPAGGDPPTGGSGGGPIP